MRPTNHNLLLKLCQQLLMAIGICCALLVLPGCGEAEKVKFEAFLDELDVDASLDSAEEIQLGVYNIASALPAPDKLVTDDDEEAEPLWVQIRFELFAVVAPEDRKAVEAACKRHRGMLDDTVVTICREASKDELDDSRWATLKSRLIDAIRPILGDDRVRQLSFSDFCWTPI